MSRTLKGLREAAGLTLRDAAEKLRAIESSAPRTHVGLKHIENRGTKSYPIIRAMSQLYGASIEEVAIAAENSGTKSVIFA